MREAGTQNFKLTGSIYVKTKLDNVGNPDLKSRLKVKRVTSSSYVRLTTGPRENHQVLRWHNVVVLTFQSVVYLAWSSVALCEK